MGEEAKSRAGIDGRDFHSFFELAGVGNIITDVEQQKFLRVNRTFCEITGYSSGELQKLTASDITHPEDRERARSSWSSFLQGEGAHFEIEKRFVRKDGRIVRGHMTCTLVRDDQNQPVHAIGIVRDVTDRWDAFKALKDERRFLEQALFGAGEREKRRIGQELHDHLCQQLLGAAFAAKVIAGEVDRGQSDVGLRLHELARIINESVVQVREFSRGLHPVESDAAGLMSALQELAKQINNSAISCDFHCPEPILVERPEAALHAYRITQEAVLNAAQTEASKITIALQRFRRSVCLCITDDGGKEGELTANPEGLAAKTLQYRARAMHGRLRMKFAPREGTKITYIFPSKQ